MRRALIRSPPLSVRFGGQQMGSGSKHRRRLVFTAATAVALVFALLAASALAHVERTSYWPNPKPDTSVTPAAGGAVPKARSLSSAARKKQPRGTKVLVVCHNNSMKRLH